MAKTRTPEQRKTMSEAQKRRYATAKSNGKRWSLTVANVVQANQLCLQLLDLVDIETASALLKSLERKTNA